MMHAVKIQCIRKLNTLTLEQKKAVLDAVDANPGKLKIEIAMEFHM